MPTAINKIVKVWPNEVDETPEDDTLTARFDYHSGPWAGKLTRGEIYRAIAEYEVGGILYYRLDRYNNVDFPFSVNPSSREVWAVAKYLIDYNPAEPPPPVPDTDKTWQGLLLALAQTTIEYLS